MNLLKRIYALASGCSALLSMKKWINIPINNNWMDPVYTHIIFLKATVVWCAIALSFFPLFHINKVCKIEEPFILVDGLSVNTYVYTGERHNIFMLLLSNIRFTKVLRIFHNFIDLSDRYDLCIVQLQAILSAAIFTKLFLTTCSYLGLYTIHLAIGKYLRRAPAIISFSVFPLFLSLSIFKACSLYNLSILYATWWAFIVVSRRGFIHHYLRYGKSIETKGRSIINWERILFTQGKYKNGSFIFNFERSKSKYE